MNNRAERLINQNVKIGGPFGDSCAQISRNFGSETVARACLPSAARLLSGLQIRFPANVIIL